ncbi:acetylornithine deacetylase [Candidatus Halobeggiatoa sp. HSG11]|nr:acetylornithine deacetylase [Candidatus Halobeggiatoa sp. HSG11]
MKIPSTLNMISELIATPSISCNDPLKDQSNQAVIELLATWCHELGFKCEIMPIPNHSGKFNLLATLGTGDDGLILAGHSDTVPYDNWQFDPFKLTEQNNRLYGLGTTDMKAFFALALTAIEQLLANNMQLKRPITILATANEETNMAGAKALTDSLKGKYALIGEPTGLQPIRMHKGIMMEAIHLHGQSGHSSNPDLGNNALEGMYQVIGELLKWRKQLQTKYNNSAFQIPIPTMNLGHIQGGDSPNRICADCELYIDLRPLPGMDLTELRSTLHQRVEKTLQNSGLDIKFKALFDGIPAMETSIDAEIVTITERLTKKLAGAVAYATEAPYLQRLGMQTIILGPGDIEQAHQPDEFIAVDRLQPMIDILTQLIVYFNK